MKGFDHPDPSFAGLGADVAARLASVVADLVLVLEPAGFVRDLCLSSDDFPPKIATTWRGVPAATLFGADSQQKLLELVQGAAAEDPQARWRQLNLLVPGGDARVVQCAAVRLQRDGTTALVVRSLQATVQMQQRLVQAQQAMERDHWQFRQVETRYRQPFHACAEGVLALGAKSLKVVEANPAAASCWKPRATRSPAARCPSSSLPTAMRCSPCWPACAPPAGRPRPRWRWAPTGCRCGCRLRPTARPGWPSCWCACCAGRPSPRPRPRPPRPGRPFLRGSPDGLVLTDADGRVLAVNAAFLELAQLGAEEQARGSSLDRWLGRTGVDLNVLLSNLRQRGVVRLFATRLHGEFGATAEVEISASRVAESPPMLGFTVRDVGRRLSAAPRGLQELPKSLSQLTELVGRVPMKDIVGETSDLIEQLCIEAALELTRGNRAAAAEMLGLSRQSLYVKLRRYGLKDLGIEGEK